jgi:hypothetical protein
MPSFQEFPSKFQDLYVKKNFLMKYFKCKRAITPSKKVVMGEVFGLSSCPMVSWGRHFVFGLSFCPVVSWRRHFVFGLASCPRSLYPQLVLHFGWEFLTIYLNYSWSDFF